jgi:hypothetical protein
MGCATMKLTQNSASYVALYIALGCSKSAALKPDLSARVEGAILTARQHHA